MHRTDPWTEQCAWSFFISLWRRHCFPISSSPSFLFSAPPDVSDSSSGTTLKLNQLHTRRHTRTCTHTYTRTPSNNCLSMSSPGLMPASLSPSLSPCAVLSSSLSLWSCGLVGPGIQFSCHPDASLSAHTHMHTYRWISCQDSLRPIRQWYWSMPRGGLKAIKGPPTQWSTPFNPTHAHTHTHTSTCIPKVICMYHKIPKSTQRHAQA